MVRVKGWVIHYIYKSPSRKIDIQGWVGVRACVHVCISKMIYCPYSQAASLECFEGIVLNVIQMFLTIKEV